MAKAFSRIMGLVFTSVLLLPGMASAAGGKAAQIVIVADTRGIGGLLGWWGSLYNESHLYFALLTCALIPIIGVIFGVVADFVMTHIGIDLKSRELAEH